MPKAREDTRKKEIGTLAVLQQPFNEFRLYESLVDKHDALNEEISRNRLMNEQKVG